MRGGDHDPREPRILIVDDDPDAACLLRDVMVHRGFTAQAVFSAAECMARMSEDPFDIVVTDVQMEGMTGIELCEVLRTRYPDTLGIVVTGFASLDTAIEAIRAGAHDFLIKPVKADILVIAVARAAEVISLRRELRSLRQMVARDGDRWDIAGSSPAIREVVSMIDRIANSDAPVLIQGESGTGKELVARALHARSVRAARPFVAINCAAMPAPLLESELFGHVRGAFTDAKQSRDGLFAQAGSGTIFLDEIAEMPLELQPKLLRVLQERRVRPIGSDTEVPIQARILTATNCDLETLVAQRRFREDLFYRIHVVSITVPPLRERHDDVLLLAQFFLNRIAQRTNKPVSRLSLPAARMLLAHDWPGNVRELENCMERAVALCRFDEVTVDDLPATLQPGPATIMMPTNPEELVTLEEMGRRYARKVVQATAGNKALAARVLGIHRRSLYRRLEPRHAIRSPDEST